MEIVTYLLLVVKSSLLASSDSYHPHCSQWAQFYNNISCHQTGPYREWPQFILSDAGAPLTRASLFTLINSVFCASPWNKSLGCTFSCIFLCSVSILACLLLWTLCSPFPLFAMAVLAFLFCYFLYISKIHPRRVLALSPGVLNPLSQTLYPSFCQHMLAGSCSLFEGHRHFLLLEDPVLPQLGYVVP